MPPTDNAPVPQEDNKDRVEEDEGVDAEDYYGFEAAPPNTNIDFDEMAQNYFALADEIHHQVRVENDALLDFEDLSATEGEADKTPILEALLQESAEPLFPGAKINRLQFGVVLMSLCTFF